jgi:hypothetical protein
MHGVVHADRGATPRQEPRCCSAKAAGGGVARCAGGTRWWGLGDKKVDEPYRSMIEVAFNEDKAIVEAQQRVISTDAPSALFVNFLDFVAAGSAGQLVNLLQGPGVSILNQARQFQCPGGAVDRFDILDVIIGVKPRRLDHLLRIEGRRQVLGPEDRRLHAVIP